MKMSLRNLIILSMSPICVSQVFAQDTELSLEELLKATTVTGTLTGFSRNKVPVSITRITAQDIKRSPAKNMFDLFEMYVPGSTYFYHNEGFHNVIRGVSSDRENKLLLVVNGINYNQLAHSGAVAELSNWDMSDIETIDIIRGPGAVTYGPGAIAGVISITTKDANTHKNNQVNVKYVNQYDSKTFNASYGRSFGENLSLYSFASITKTHGIRPENFGIDDGGRYGWVGNGEFDRATYSSSVEYGTHPTAIYNGDYFKTPQMKLHLNLKFLKEFQLTARFTKFTLGTPSGDAIYAQSVESSGTTTVKDSAFADFRHIKNQRLNTTLENDHSFSENISLKSLVSYSSEDFSKTNAAITDKVNYGSVKNYASKFAEDETFLRSIVKYNGFKNTKLAFGTEYSHKSWGKGWGDDWNMFYMSDGNVISGDTKANVGCTSSATKACYDNSKGFSSDQISFLSEGTFDFGERNTTLFSARWDKNSMTDPVWSPRLAHIFKVNNENYFKFIFQNSGRINTAEQLYMSRRADKASPQEKMTSYELMYNHGFTNNFQTNFSVFYNKQRNVSFDTGSQSTTAKGELRLWGLELEAAYNDKKFSVNGNHSIVKQIRWGLAPGQYNSNVSYSDYNCTPTAGGTGGICTTAPSAANTTIRGEGNDLNNSANHVTKISGTYNFNDFLSGFVATRVFWGFQGEQAAVEAMRKMSSSSTNTTVNRQGPNSLEALTSTGVYKTQVKFDASVSYKFLSSFEGTLYCMNLLKAGKRLSYDGGNNKSYAVRNGFLYEPRTFGVNLAYNF